MSGASLGSGPQSREYSAKETGEVSQGCQAAGGLLSGSCQSLLGLQVGQELVASRGLAWFGAQAQGIPRQRDWGGLPGTRGAAIRDQTAAWWAAGLAGAGRVGGLPRVSDAAHGRLRGRDPGGLPGTWRAGLCLPPAPLAAAGVPTGLPGLCAPSQGGLCQPRTRGRSARAPRCPEGLASASCR